MLFKKLFFYHLIPLFIAVCLTLGFILKSNSKNVLNKTLDNRTPEAIVSREQNFNNQVALSIALKRRVPVLFGSSELTANHLEGLARNFFTKDASRDKFLSVGHAGFQNFAMLTVLAANKKLLKYSKVTIILSPGWFEKQYCSGTSLTSFLEFCTPNYLYQIHKDETIDIETKNYIKNYISRNYDKISKPDATMRLMGKKEISSITNIVNYPFYWLDKLEIKNQEQIDFDLISQKIILKSVSKSNVADYHFYNRFVNWDSLIITSQQQFKTISNNNTIAVANDYYNSWLKDKPKKKLTAVDKENNQEFKDFIALVHFLKEADCKPIFVIMPLNTKAHQNLEVLNPIINDINKVLTQNNFKVLDMFTPNLKHYEEGTLEDIMHPYNAGWYQIDKFILENHHD